MTENTRNHRSILPKSLLLFAALCSLCPLWLTAAPATLPTTLPTTQQVQNTQAELFFTEGRDALFRRDFAKAIDLLTKAAAEDPAKTQYRLHLARALQYADRTQDAEKLLNQILKATPDHVEAGQLLGEIYAKQENWKAVAALLEPLLKYRHDYSSYHLLAEAKYSLGDNEAARKYYEEAIKLNPDSAADHYQLGNIHLAGNFFSLAAESYQNALRLGLASPILHYKLGSAYFNLRNYFGNIATITVKSGAPGTISGNYYLIEPVPGQKDVFRAAPQNSAIYHVAKAIAEGIGDRPDIQFLRANIYLNAGRFQKAYDMYKQMQPVIAKEDLPLFFYYYAQTAFGVGQYEQYLSLLQEAIKLNKAAYQPTLVDAYVKVAEQYNQAGQLDKYIEYLNKAVDQSPQTATLHLRLGIAYEEASKYKEALVQWQMVLDLEPDHPKRLELLNLIAKHREKPATQPTTKPL
jgi:tetratricopeptide (TPR) repeat protein